MSKNTIKTRKKQEKKRKHLNISKILHQIGQKLKIFHSCVDQ